MCSTGLLSVWMQFNSFSIVPVSSGTVADPAATRPLDADTHATEKRKTSKRRGLQPRRGRVINFSRAPSGKLCAYIHTWGRGRISITCEVAAAKVKHTLDLFSFQQKTSHQLLVNKSWSLCQQGRPPGTNPCTCLRRQPPLTTIVSGSAVWSDEDTKQRPKQRVETLKHDLL